MIIANAIHQVAKRRPPMKSLEQRREAKDDNAIPHINLLDLAF